MKQVPYLGPTNITQSLCRPIIGPEASRFLDNQCTKVVRLSPLSTGCLYPPENIPGTHFC